jgi:hypothetical protein
MQLISHMTIVVDENVNYIFIGDKPHKINHKIYLYNSNSQLQYKCDFSFIFSNNMCLYIKYIYNEKEYTLTYNINDDFCNEYCLFINHENQRITDVF